MPTAQNPAHIQTKSSRSYWFHAMLLLMFILPLAIGLTIIREHRQINEQGDTIMSALMEFTENITLYHLWLEEYLVHPDKKKQKLFSNFLQRAKMNLSGLQQLIHQDGEHSADKTLAISAIQQQCDRFIATGRQRVASPPGLAGIDSPLDHVFNNQFHMLMDNIHATKVQLEVRQRADADRLVSDSHLLLGIESILMLFTWVALILITRHRNALVTAILEQESSHRKTLEEDLAMKDLLLQQQDRLKLHFQQTPMGVIEWTPEFEVVRWNPAAEKIFGYTEEEAVGRKAFGLILNEEQSNKLGDLTKNLVRQTSGYHNINHNITKDGTIILCEWYNTPLLDHDGNTVGIASLMVNITERMELKDTNQRFANMLENTSDLVVIMDAVGGILYINKAGRELLDIAPDEVLDQMTMSEFHSDAEMEHLKNDVLPCTAKGPVQEKISCISRKNEEIPVSCVIMQEKNEDSSVRYYMLMGRDLRQEQQAQAKLEHAQRLESLGVLAGGIAHDFNNILTAILGNAALANNKLNHSSPIQKYLQNIEDASQRAAELCKQMLAYSGKGRFIVEILDINQAVSDIIRLMEVSIHKNVVLKYHLGDHLPMIEADTAQLQQVIMNLVINASEAIEGKSGVISIHTGVMSVDAAYLKTTTSDAEVAEPGRYVYLEVSDTGCGMDEGTRLKVFEPFFTTKFTGRGLGMSAILGIVRGHQGAIKCYSEKGKGTTFKVLFTCSDKKPLLEDVDEAQTPAQRPMNGCVLVVDDEETIREMACMILEEMGLTTMQAADGQEGVNMFKAHHADIVAVLMDMTMPKMDGTEAFSAIRQINPDIKVILSSGYNEQDAINRFTGKGLAGFIQKPYLPDALKKIILDIVDVEGA